MSDKSLTQVNTVDDIKKRIDQLEPRVDKLEKRIEKVCNVERRIDEVELNVKIITNKVDDLKDKLDESTKTMSIDIKDITKKVNDKTKEITDEFNLFSNDIKKLLINFLIGVILTIGISLVSGLYTVVNHQVNLFKSLHEKVEKSSDKLKDKIHVIEKRLYMLKIEIDTTDN